MSSLGLSIDGAIAGFLVPFAVVLARVFNGERTDAILILNSRCSLLLLLTMALANGGDVIRCRFTAGASLW